MKGKFKKFDPIPGAHIKKPQSVMNIEAVVENKPQKLRSIRPYAAMMKEVPKDIYPEAQIVLHALFSCFDRQGKIEEGKFEDLVWGFEQGKIPRACTLVGIKNLEEKGYIEFRSPDNHKMTIEGDQISEAWIHYTKKLMDLVYEKEAKNEDSTPK